MKKILLSALFLVPFMNYAQFNQSFEGSTNMPAGWTVITGGDAAQTWAIVDLTDSAITAAEGTNVASIQYGATAHNDFLVTPSIAVTAGTSDFFSFFGRSRDPQYPETIALKLSTTTATEAAFTVTLIPTVAPASGAGFTQYQVDLSDYVGQTVYIAFHSTTTDMFVFDVDAVVSGALPECGVATGYTILEPAPTPTTINLGWTAAVGASTPEGYQVDFDTDPEFVPGDGALDTDTTSISLDELTQGTLYYFYVRTNCGEGSFGEWDGPYTFSTPWAAFDISEGDYDWSFEPSVQNGGWSFLNTNAQTGGAAWNIYLGDEQVPAQDGDQFAGIIGTAAASNSWIFSRGIALEANEQISLSYYLQMLALAGNGNTNNVKVTIGTDRTAAAQTTVLNDHQNYTEADYTEQTAMFTATAAGTYYIGFNYTAPAHTAANNGGLLLDTFHIDEAQTAGTEDFASSTLAVFPNPASNVINVTNTEVLNNVQIVDLNGRTVKSVKVNATEAQINVSDLAAGVYMMNIATDKGTTTKKIVKN